MIERPSILFYHFLPIASGNGNLPAFSGGVQKSKQRKAVEKYSCGFVVLKRQCRKLLILKEQFPLW
jgi:hypothetical protein